MNDLASLTRDEAATRSDLLTVERYDVHVDLRGLYDGELWAATSTISFTCREPGAEHVRRLRRAGRLGDAQRRGRSTRPPRERGRLPAARTSAPTTCWWSARPDRHLLGQRDPAHRRPQRQAGLRLVDLRARHGPLRLRLLRPARPQGAPRVRGRRPRELDGDEQLRARRGSRTSTTAAGAGPSATRRRCRRTSRSSTPGPFHELRSSRGGYDLGLFGRQSLKQFLERDAEELFDLTERGLAFFGERFGQPFPQERYDQVFVPNMGGAMENWGSVTWTDSVLYRSTPDLRPARRAGPDPAARDGPHVVRRPGHDALVGRPLAQRGVRLLGLELGRRSTAPTFTDEWATFLAGGKMGGYRQDMSPATHPIRGEVPDVAQAMANFDAITYTKGASVLKQLMAYVGEDAFVEGLRAYFRAHAWGNTVLDDLMSAIGEAAGRDLSGWTVAWLDRVGTDTLRLTDGAIIGDLARRRRPASPPPRRRVLPRRRDHDVSDPGITLLGVTEVETSGTLTPVDLPEADLHLLNAGDLTFAAVRPDPGSVRHPARPRRRPARRRRPRAGRRHRLPDGLRR